MTLPAPFEQSSGRREAYPGRVVVKPTASQHNSSQFVKVNLTSRGRRKKLRWEDIQIVVGGFHGVHPSFA
ncbi:MAG: hypothetical protein ACFWTR_03320 [Pseudomonas shahriarae]|uniref:hypothetical protein n=1 Tax=Pseudomonas sp. WS 5413 TaxID=2717488 RepID=UPI001472A90B|nr:hypothetical protein [Pseudomonas sp. WS 5413]NMX34881.1 hypothetical protein [Pseudomonas sp. WS 5413]